MSNKRRNEMKMAAERLLEDAEVDYEFGSTQRGHQYVIVRNGHQSRKVFFSGGEGRDQKAMLGMLSFLRRAVAQIA